jgi:hypothetical protein
MSFTYLWAVKNLVLNHRQVRLFSVDLTCCTTFILLIELEQDIKITIRARTELFLRSHRIEIKLVAISVIHVLAVF